MERALRAAHEAAASGKALRKAAVTAHRQALGTLVAEAELSPKLGRYTAAIQVLRAADNLLGLRAEAAKACKAKDRQRVEAVLEEAQAAAGAPSAPMRLQARRVRSLLGAMELERDAKRALAANDLNMMEHCLAEAAKLGHGALEQDLAQRLKAVKSEQRYKSWRREKARKGKSERLQAQARAQKAREAAAEQEAEQKRASARKYKEWLRQKHREGRSTKKAKALEEERTRLDERLRDQQLRALNDLEFDRWLAEKQAGEQDLGRRRQAEEQEYRRQRRTAEEKRLVDLYRHHHAELSWQVPPTPRGRRW